METKNLPFSRVVAVQGRPEHSRTTVLPLASVEVAL